jgi:hypothetical protein
VTFESDRTRPLAPRPRDEERTMRLPAVGREPIAFAALAGAALLAYFLAPPNLQGAVARLAILLIGIVAAWRVLGRSGAITASTTERFNLDLSPPAVPRTEIGGLRSVETALRMATASAFGLETMLKPRLRELARWRLQRNHAVNLDTSPDVAQRILEDRLWHLVRPDGSGTEFGGPGIPLDDLEAAIDQLERT